MFDSLVIQKNKTSVSKLVFENYVMLNKSVMLFYKKSLNVLMGASPVRIEIDGKVAN